MISEGNWGRSRGEKWSSTGVRYFLPVEKEVDCEPGPNSLFEFEMRQFWKSRCREKEEAAIQLIHRPYLDGNQQQQLGAKDAYLHEPRVGSQASECPPCANKNKSRMLDVSHDVMSLRTAMGGGRGGGGHQPGREPLDFRPLSSVRSLGVGLDDGGVGEDARQGRNVWGDAVSSVRTSNKWTKIMREEDGAMAVGCRHSTKGHNNQPNIGVLNRAMKHRWKRDGMGRENDGGRRGSTIRSF
ncbi:hypothetical protein ACHAXA_001903 [Cyclostephanos tholiformis]|uniref:Uncharacterized protein n=1 Tax=Cyclostephanos tholiformis TaxID=382380 RepID=A0ABD3R5D4_9STRA